MSTRFKGLALLAILVSAAGVAPAFASPYSTQNLTNTNSTLGNTFPSSASAVTVTTDKPSYNDGGKVTISGSTKDYISGTPVTVIVRNPIGNVIKVDQVDLGTDRTYSTTIMAGGGLWQAAGTYSVLVEFGSKDRSATTTFQFTGSGGGPGNTIKVVGTDFSVTYSITNGKVLGITADIPAKSLKVSIETSDKGVLTITLPRGLIDSKKSDNQTDDAYVILNDGQQNTDFQETTTTQTDRTLSIPFENGTTQIEIIGTWIIPEFGPIAALVLAIAIISIIAVSAKTGLRFMPKY